MALTAPLFWVATAFLGIYMFGVTLRTGMSSASASTSRLPSGVVFWHAVLALGALTVWVIYLGRDEIGFAWAAFAMLVVVASLGGFMGLRWLRGRGGTPEQRTARRREVAEQQIPTPVVLAHGAGAAVTLVLVLLTALQVGG